MRIDLFVIVMMVAVACGAGQSEQNDWSRGPAPVESAASFGNGFESAENISWLSIPGQIALSSIPLTTPIRTEIAAEGSRGAYGLAAADFEGDGDVDIFGTSDSQGGILLWLNHGGNPPVLERHVIDSDYAGGTSLHPVDVDRDGDLDLVGAAQNPGNNVSWWRNDSDLSMEWQRFEIHRPFGVACNVFSADVNGDGWPDVLSTSWTTARLNVWYHSGTDPVEWTVQTLAHGLRGAHSAVAGDVDGDGDLDVVGTGANDSEVLLLKNLGGEPVEWSSEVIGNDLVGVRYAAIHDINNDGWLDIVAASADGKLVLWTNQDDGTSWERFLVDHACTGGHWVDVDDVNGDGLVDLVVAAYVAGKFFWYRQESDGIWTRFELEERVSESPLTAIAADVDGGGDLEIVASEWTPGTFFWWKVGEFAASGELLSTVVELDDGERARKVSWDADTPPGTLLTVEYRSGESEGLLGDWREVEASGQMVELEGDFLQYRLRLSTGNPAVSPVIRSIGFGGRVDGSESSSQADFGFVSD